MVDWASQDRLYPSGYRSAGVRYHTARVNSSLPYSVSLNKSKILLLIQSSMKISLGHNCRSQSKQFYDDVFLFDHLQHGLNQSIEFYRKFAENDHQKR